MGLGRRPVYAASLKRSGRRGWVYWVLCTGKPGRSGVRVSGVYGRYRGYEAAGTRRQYRRRVGLGAGGAVAPLRTSEVAEPTHGTPALCADGSIFDHDLSEMTDN